MKDVQRRSSPNTDYANWPDRINKNSKTTCKRNRKRPTDLRNVHGNNNCETATKIETKEGVSKMSLLEQGHPSPKYSASNASYNITTTREDVSRHANRRAQQQKMHCSTRSVHFVDEESVPQSGSCEVQTQQQMPLFQQHSSDLKSRDGNQSDRSVRNQEVVVSKEKKHGRAVNAHSHQDRRRSSASIPFEPRRPSFPFSTSSEANRKKSNRSVSYAKQMRSIESHSRARVPRRYSNTAPRIIPHSMRNRDPSPKKRATAKIWALEVTDRIEKSRNPGIDAHIENSQLLESEDVCKRDHSTQSSDINQKGIFGAQLDRIECIREDMDGNSQTIISRLRERTENQYLPLRPPKLFERNSFAEGEENSIWDPNQVSSHGVNDKNTQFQSYGGTEIEDQKSARSLHSQDFQSLRIEYSEYIRSLVAKNDAAEPSSLDSKDRPIFVIRSRPLLDSEVQRGHFSIIDIPQESSSTLALYETNILPDRKVLDFKAHVFKFDAVFSERASFDDFYSRTVQMNVKDAMKGGSGAIILFGSDEFGKSLTMSDIEKRVAFDLFTNPSTSPRSVSVKYLGLGPCNDLCIDLLSPVHHFAEVIESDGGYQAEGVTEIEISSATKLLDTLCRVKQRLASERILRRESESSSYSLCQIMIRNGNVEPGLLSLVLCPSGDEVCFREIYTNYRDTNPLANLMEMIRNKGSTQNGLVGDPPQPCNLTKLLGKSIIARKKPKVCLVAAVSPSSEDTDATLLTMLSSREYMTANTCSNNESDDLEIDKKDTQVEDVLVMPRQWSKTQLLIWLKRKHLVDAAFEGGELSGKTIMNMTKVQLNDYFYRSDEKNGDNGANKLFNALRAENDRIARLRVKRKFALQKAKK